MNSFKSTMMKVLLVLFGLGLAILAGCGGKSSGASTGTPTATVKITGTAAMGAALAGATVTIKDSAGMTKTGTAGPTGAYIIDVTGLTPPYLVKVDHLGIHILYSVGTAAGVINTHPLTDLIIRTWYKVQGTDVVTEFAKATPAAPPTATELGVIKQVVKNLVVQFLGLLGNIDSTTSVRLKIKQNHLVIGWWRNGSSSVWLQGA